MNPIVWWINPETGEPYAMTRARVEEACRELGAQMLRDPWRSYWSPEKPTTGFCYVVSEALYHYVYPDFWPVCLRVGDQNHWYLERGISVIDFTAQQFDEPLEYEKGRRIGFQPGAIQTPRGKISRRGFEMAMKLGVVPG